MGLKGKLRQIIEGKKSNRRVINAMDRQTDNSRARTLRRVQVSESEIVWWDPHENQIHGGGLLIDPGGRGDISQWEPTAGVSDP